MGYNENSLKGLTNAGKGRPKKPKTILRAQIVELQEEYDSIVGNRFLEVIDGLLTLALKSEDEGIRLKASQYVVNRLLGMPTTYAEQTVESVESEEIAAAKALLQPAVQPQVKNE